jgi:hypothetical protein
MSETPTAAIETMMEPVAPEAPFWQTLECLPSMMKALANTRQSAEYWAGVVKVQEQVLAETEQYQFLQKQKDNLAEANRLVTTLDAAVRKAALDDFKTNGSKKLFAGIQVKMVTKVTLYTDKVREWALEHMPELLVLDAKAATKIASTGKWGLDMATISKEPQVNIDKDLSIYLAEVTP